MSTHPLRLGLLGCADIAWRRTLPMIQCEPAVELVAVAARDMAKAKVFADRFGGQAMEDYRALLERPDIDAVYIPLPAGLHREWIVRTLNAGKHVLVEKPLTTRHVDTVEVLELAGSRGLTLMENLTSLRHGLHTAVQDLVSGGEVGELRMLSAAFGFPPLSPKDIRYRPDLGGGALLDVGVYPLSTAQRFLGPDLEVVGATLKQDPECGVDVSGDVLLRTPDGRTAHVAFGFEHGYRCDYALWGSRGRIFVDRAYTPPPTWHPVIRLERQDEVRELTLPPEDQFATTLRAFLRAVSTSEQPAEAEVAIRVQAQLVDQIRDRAQA
ncbi:Gfo/Idh/MocA family oxidoreductase [Spongiactinospora sp. TRM90649]|uniref:Gfo/Idh/MocA family protein n=1 Tax=Spongiactinospora sp. TRM90649 TaxID=3031114 RepID=UPI0023F73028|nr:Gfo/Idh/MocA family oxidoreductase [Spongiactinospora sp. TRM90649]MDF5753502.1 Gfo/Idh/MocA family oxidoreductase [Spongiactinospora sp. TRM90649]